MFVSVVLSHSRCLPQVVVIAHNITSKRGLNVSFTHTVLSTLTVSVILFSCIHRPSTHKLNDTVSSVVGLEIFPLLLLFCGR